jgi:hypothetical protein
MRRNRPLFLVPLALAGVVPVLLIGLGISGYRPAAPTGDEQPSPWFTDVTDEVGLDFVHDPGPVKGDFFLPEILGSGAALFDFDGDGLLDIYLLNNGGPTGRPNQLYRQLPSGKFENVGAGSGLDFSGYCMGVAVGDVDNDGKPDVLVTMYGGLKLFHNEGNGKFIDITRTAGLENPLWGTSAAFLDFDRDGYLDLVVVNYLDYDPTIRCTSPRGEPAYCQPRAFGPTVSKLFRNLGAHPAKGVRFEDVSLSSGIGKLPSSGLGVVCADFDGDGWIDIFIANDAAANHLWINRHNGTFSEEAVRRGLAFNAMGQAEGNMGIAWGDADGDGLQDVFITHLNIETNTLWKQGPRGFFHDRTGNSNVNRPRWRSTGFGTMLADFDHDGHLDLVIANGKVAWEPILAGADLGPHFNPYADRNQFFVNEGWGKFRDQSASEKALCDRLNIARALAVGDLRNDGTLHVLVTAVNDRARLFRCYPSERGHWVVLRVLEEKLQRDALGAEVVVRAGKRTYPRTVLASASYLSSNDPRVHVGLGKADHYDGIEVTWPDGVKEEFSGGKADRHRTVIRGQGRVIR